VSHAKLKPAPRGCPAEQTVSPQSAPRGALGAWPKDYTSFRQLIRGSSSRLTKDLHRAKWLLIT
jgi:hypothetical protein